MPDFRHLAPRFRASKTRNGLIFVALPLGNNPAHWTRCRLVRLHEAPNRASGQVHATQTELSCTPIPPTPKAGPQRYTSYIISVRLFVRALGPSRANPRAPPRRRRVGPRKRRGSDEGKGRGGAHRVTSPLPTPPSGRPWASKRTPGEHFNTQYFERWETKRKKNPPARSGVERISYTLSGRS